MWQIGLFNNHSLVSSPRPIKWGLCIFTSTFNIFFNYIINLLFRFYTYTTITYDTWYFVRKIRYPGFSCHIVYQVLYTIIARESKTDKIDIPNILDSSLSWPDKGTSIQNGGVRLIVIGYSEMMRSCNCFCHTWVTYQSQHI